MVTCLLGAGFPVVMFTVLLSEVDIIQGLVSLFGVPRNVADACILYLLEHAGDYDLVKAQRKIRRVLMAA